MAAAENELASAISPDDMNPGYGSMEDDESIHHQNLGGMVNEMPTQGYCLVFLAETDWYILRIQDNKLSMERNPEFDEAEWNEKEYDKKLKRAVGGKKKRADLLRNFKHANINYKIMRSRDKAKKYIYVIITAKTRIVEEWADRHDRDMPIEPAEAVKAGRNYSAFLLAHRTYLPGDEAPHFIVKEVQGNNKPQGNDEEHVGKKFDKLPLEAWDNIHVPYETSIAKEIYKHDPYGNVLDNRTYLRLLYEMLTDDVKMGGANFLEQKYVPNKMHPLTAFFALNQPLMERPSVDGWLKCKSPGQLLAFVDELRDYYGENVGFYFSFLVHYTKWLYPMAILGTIWEIVQLSIEFNPSSPVGIATPGSTVIILIAIMWSVFMIENWYRREWKLRFKWGMMRYEETEVPRPTFQGKITVSRENGEIIEDYVSKPMHFLKRLASFSTLLFCVAIVVAAVAGLFVAKGSAGDDAYISVGIGVANAVWIQITNRIYTVLAIKLNEWEGHRLQQDYYNNLVIKRIVFIVFNSFYSLFLIGFIDDQYGDDDELRLNSLRTQLLTLFFSAVVINNSLEIGFPLLFKYIKEFCAKKAEEDWDQAHGGNSSLLDDDPTGAEAQVNVVDAGDDNVEMGNGHGDRLMKQRSSKINVNNEVMEDIEEQMLQGPSPDVLSNTAEIVVLHGYIILFVIVFPIMPLLAVINNYIEFRLDTYNLLEGKRPVPMSASGIGVWKTVMSSFNLLAIGTNFGLLTFRTPLMSDILVAIGVEGSERNLWIVFFICVLILLFVMMVIRTAVPDMSESVREAVARQEACEKHLFMAPMKGNARKQAKRKLRESMLKVQVDRAGNDEEKHEQ